MMSTSTLRWTSMAAVAFGALLLSAGCSEAVRTGRSPSYLMIESLRAISGNEDFEESDVLASDVQTLGGIIEDAGVATFRLALKDIGPPGSSTSPTSNNAITVNRYRVAYRRTDGRNTPGVDVPHPFEGAGTVTVVDTASLAFQLVRVQAKLEPPLMNLRSSGAAKVISTIADVTFFGRDQVGNDVSVTGSIGVNFADWADPED